MELHEETVFNEALDIADPAERAHYLERVCHGRPEFRLQIDYLLNMYQCGSALEPTSIDIDSTPETRIAEQVGDVIGRYKLLERIGEGGMGVVYMAQQQEPVRRQVALKIIKAGMDTKQVVARFEAEQQALAMMNHPNIAKVLDADATDSGRPFFVMELVRGVPITEFCDQQKLNLHQRLKLFVQVCEAVHHAHQKGIIHRDLKPGNLLVELHDVRAVPKVIDFGIAKATNQELTQRTLFTNFQQLVGTPMYMSPEQAQMSGLDVDTRSDIYSLGVLLYELITGTTPVTKEMLENAPFDKLRRLICEEEPPRASTRISTLRAEQLSTLAANQRVDVKALSTSLRGELDWVIAKALEKDRACRYQSALGFGEDLKRFLQGSPVEAHPPSLTYRLRKLVRRHAATVGFFATLMVVLLLASMVSIRYAIIANQARQEAKQNELDAIEQNRIADQQRAEAVKQQQLAQQAEHTAKIEAENARRSSENSRAVNRFLTEFVFARADPSGFSSDGQKAFRDAMDDAVNYVDQWYPDDAPLKGSLCQSIARIYFKIGRFEESAATYKQALELLQTTDISTPVLLECQEGLGLSLFELGKSSEAEEILRHALSTAQRELGETVPAAQSLMLGLATVLRPHAVDESKQLVQKCYELRRRALGDDHAETAVAAAELATILLQQGNLEKAHAAMEPALQILRDRFGVKHRHTQMVLAGLAEIKEQQGDLQSSQELCQELLTAQLSTLGPVHSSTLATMRSIARLLEKQGRFHEAEAMLRDLLHVASDNTGTSISVIDVVNQLGGLLWRQGRLIDAAALHKNWNAIKELKTQPAINLALQNTDILLGLGEYSQAEQLLRETWESSKRELGKYHNVSTASLKRLILCLYLQRKLIQGDQLARQNLDQLNPDDDYYRSGIPEGLTLSSLSMLKKNPWTETDLHRSLHYKQEQLGSEHLSTALTQAVLGAHLSFCDQPNAARVLLEQSLTTRRTALPPNHWVTAETESLLGDCYRRLKEFEKGEPLLLGAFRIVETDNNVPDALRLEFVQRLCDLYERWQKPEESMRWHATLEKLLRSCLDDWKKLVPEDDQHLLSTASRLGDCLVKLERFGQAEELLLHNLAVERLSIGWQVDTLSVVKSESNQQQTVNRLLELYDQWGKPDQANSWRRLVDSLRPAGEFSSIDTNQIALENWAAVFKRSPQPLFRRRLLQAIADLAHAHQRSDSLEAAYNTFMQGLAQFQMLEGEDEWSESLRGAFHLSAALVLQDLARYSEARDNFAVATKIALRLTSSEFPQGNGPLQFVRIAPYWYAMFLANCPEPAFRDSEQVYAIVKEFHWFKNALQLPQAYALWHSGEPSEALDLLKGQRPAAVNVLALIALGEPEQAMMHYEMLVANHKNSILAQQELSFRSMWYENRKTAELNQEAAQALGLGEHQRSAIDAHWYGIALIEHGRSEDANAFFDQAIGLDAEYAEPLLGKAIVLENQDPFPLQELLKLVEKYFVLKPQSMDPRAYKLLGTALAVQGDYSAAIDSFRRACEIEPTSENAHGGLAESLAAAGKYAEAVNEYELSINLAPGWDYPQVRLAWLLVSCSDPAVRDYDRAIELAQSVCQRSQLSKNWRTLGIANYLKGNFGTGLQALEQACALGERDDPTCNVFLAMSHFRVGHEDEAHETFQRVIIASGQSEADDPFLWSAWKDAQALLGATPKIPTNR